MDRIGRGAFPCLFAYGKNEPYGLRRKGQTKEGIHEHTNKRAVTSGNLGKLMCRAWDKKLSAFSHNQGKPRESYDRFLGIAVYPAEEG